MEENGKVSPNLEMRLGGEAFLKNKLCLSGVDQPGFDGVARVEVSHEIVAELDEGSRGILVQGAVGDGEAMARAVAGGIALALGGDGSSGTGPLAREAWI